MLSNLPRKEIGKRFIVMTMTIGACFMLAEATAVFRFVDYRAVFGTFERQNVIEPAQAGSSTGNSFGYMSRIIILRQIIRVISGVRSVFPGTLRNGSLFNMTGTDFETPQTWTGPILSS